MAGSIPPLISSTPPPLCAFDDDEEEEEDEFGMYTATEDIEYNECISYKENNGEKHGEGKSRGEQDSTSQDSATDSGLCPDSEGMSPTPHSDEERTIKLSANSVCNKLCQKPEDVSTLTTRLNSTWGTEGLDLPSGFSAPTNLPNGHVTAEDSEDDFGNFENFECTPAGFSEQNLPSDGENNQELNLTKPLDKEKSVSLDLKKEEVLLDDRSNNEKFKVLSDHEENVDRDMGGSSENEECTDVEIQHISNVEFSEFNSANKNGEIHVEKPTYLEESKPSNDLPILSNDQNIEIQSEVVEFNQIDDEFDDFTDFKADFSNFDTLNSEQCDSVSEYSKTIVEQKHLEQSGQIVSANPNEASDEDEFSDFTEFSSSDCPFISAQKSNSIENVSHIPILSSDNSDVRTETEFQDWVSVFPSSSDPAEKEGGDVVILRENDAVWSRLIPMESSPALSYQWAESQANRHLLSALSIDSRNILMMPWMPRFAANLSCGPLQPVKALEPLQPTPAPVVVTQPHLSSGPESVPDAHFDWVGSGLTNPLDCPKPVLKLQKALSAEAETVLSSLPDLSFMRKAYIDFPINKG